MGYHHRATAVIVGIAVTATVAFTAIPGAGAAPPSTSGSPPSARSAASEAGIGSTPASCATNTGPGRAHCYLSIQVATPPTRAVGQTAAGSTCTVDESAGYTPCNLQSAYGLTTLSATGGKSNLVAVVDPFDDPNAAGDLGQYRTMFGLPPCTTANHCFKKVNQEGVQGSYPTPDTGSAQEISLDIEMVSAVCPNCHILLVEANTNGFGDLGTAENEALTLGAKVISNSWGTGEFNGETGWDGDWNHPGVDITFSSGDGAYQGGVQYPSSSPYVTSVGGTQLTPAANTRGWTETAWVGSGSPPTQGSGSGCSAYEPKPPWQHDAGCANRTSADVSAVAADVITYDSYNEPGWVYEFGTSVSSPIVAGIYGLAKNKPTSTIAASAAYASTAFHDITKGKEGTCTPTYLCQAVKGYDGPTGLGSPRGKAAFVVPVTPAASISSVTLSGSPSNPTITISGSNLDPIAPVGSPESCQAGDTGDVYGSSGLWFSDTTQSWTAGQDGDCIGLVLDSWSTSQVTFGFGNQYSNYPAAESGDQIQVEAQGTTFTGTLG